MATSQTPRTSLIGAINTESTTITVDYADPRSRSAQSWAASKAVMASRGEVDGPRVAEADAALSWWRVERRLSAEVAAGHLPQANVDKVLAQLADLPPSRQ